jgi:opacity protein-like surface antigen
MIPQCAFSQPGEGVKWGNWKLHPFGGVQEQFDSNIFLDSTGEKKDWITSLSAGFDAEGILAGDINITGGYSLTYNLFANYSKQSALNQYGNLALQREFKDVTVKVNDVFQYVYDRPDTETTQRVLWDKNDLGVIASSEYNRFGWSLEYRDIMYNYETDGWQSENRWDNNVNAIATYRIFTKTYLLAELNYGNINYCSDTNSDANLYQGLIGVKGKLTAKLTGTVKAGWQYRDYTRSTQKDCDSPVTMAGLLEQFTDRDTLSIDWIRSPYESLYTGTNYYVDNSIALKYKHKFTEKLTGNLKGLYRLSQYPTETVVGGAWKKRLDNTWSVGAGAEYAVQKWLTCKAGYDFIQRKSNFGTFDYNDNLATISVNARY